MVYAAFAAQVQHVFPAIRQQPLLTTTPIIALGEVLSLTEFNI
jgi:hypothetical protein